MKRDVFETDGKTNLKELLIIIREWVKVSFCCDLTALGFPEDYLSEIGRVFDVLYECSCRQEDKIVLNGVVLADFANLRISNDFVKSDDFINAVRDFGATEIEMRIILISMDRAVKALDKIPPLYPDRKTCFQFWGEKYASDTPDGNEQFYAGDLEIPGRPKHYEQLTLIISHLEAMQDAAAALRQGISGIAKELAELN